MTNADVSNSEVPSVEIPLNEIRETTKNFLLAASQAGKSVPEVIAEQLDRAAAAAGYLADEEDKTEAA